MFPKIYHATTPKMLREQETIGAGAMQQPEIEAEEK
jgi:hypothetical protein